MGKSKAKETAPPPATPTTTPPADAEVQADVRRIQELAAQSTARPGLSAILDKPALRRDPKNLNRGTARGKALIKKSIETDGFARPTVAAADGTLIGGNHANQAAIEAGLDDVIYVPTDGTKRIVHIRTDIKDASDPKFTRLAINDNRTNELNYDPDEDATIAVMQEQHIDPADCDYQLEEVPTTVDASIASEATSGSGSGSGTGSSLKPGLGLGLFISCKDESDQRDLMDRMRTEGRQVRVSSMTL